MNAMLPAIIEPEMGFPSRSRDGVHIIEGEFSEAPSRGALISQADSDRHLIELWLGKHASRHTRQNYARHARRFLAFVRKPPAHPVACGPIRMLTFVNCLLSDLRKDPHVRGSRSSSGARRNRGPAPAPGHARRPRRESPRLCSATRALSH